ncbi:MAG: T9SS type A sorting domain-containing protein [Bacteroidetes bacterium]|nr:T9SS type A sorting domain-containing protein [Bacteroidota bacterium]
MKSTMILTSLLLTATLFVFSQTQAQQVISQFNFNSTPLTSATYGPGASSANASASSGGTGVRFATGGPSVGLDLVVSGATFDVPSLDVYIEFARNESDAVFFERGGTKFYMTNGQLYFDYRVIKAGNAADNFTLGPASAPPMGVSGAYNTLRVVYLSSTGEAAVYIGGTRVLYNDGADNKDLHWHQAGDMIIGEIMDGGGNNFETLGSITFYNEGASVLPVELVSFSAALKHDGVQLRWKTATELNNFGFEVQRSSDRDNWETLGFVQGYGTSNSPKSYNYVDATALRTGHTVFFYRLRQIDRDGTDDYSAILETPLMDAHTFTINPARPNPFNPSTTVGLNVDSETTVSLVVFDASGREVARLLNNEVLSAGYHDVHFNAEHLPSGIYFATVLSAQGMQTVKMVLQK